MWFIVARHQTKVDVIIKIRKVFQEKLAADVKIFLTGLLPRNLNKSKQRNKILTVNSYLKESCKDETNIYYLQQDCNWVHKDQSLDTSLHYKYYLHLLEPGSDKFASRIVKILIAKIHL